MALNKAVTLLDKLLSTRRISAKKKEALSKYSDLETLLKVLTALGFDRQELLDMVEDIK